jgi:hypothetical protein
LAFTTDAPSFFGWHYHSGATVARSKGRVSSGRRRKSVPTEEENKASFRRYLEETWNQSNLGE